MLCWATSMINMFNSCYTVIHLFSVNHLYIQIKQESCCLIEKNIPLMGKLQHLQLQRFQEHLSGTDHQPGIWYYIYVKSWQYFILLYFSPLPKVGLIFQLPKLLQTSYQDLWKKHGFYFNGSRLEPNITRVSSQSFHSFLCT